MKVSVIITTYERPSLLKRAIQSVLNQDFTAFELIIVDDGSRTYDMAELVAPLRDPRMFFFLNGTNQGSARSLNVGLSFAQGEYIAILDDDDYWSDSQKLSKQVRFLEEHPEWVVVGTNGKVNLIDDAGSLIRVVNTNVPLGDGQIRNQMLVNNSIAHVSAMYRRAAAEKVGVYDETLPRGKDWDLMLKLGTVGKMANLADYCVVFDEKRKVSLKLGDSWSKLKVLVRHRNNYPHFMEAFSVECVRWSIFLSLSVLRWPWCHAAPHASRREPEPEA